METTVLIRTVVSFIEKVMYKQNSGGQGGWAVASLP